MEKIFKVILEFLLPQKTLTREILAMSAEDFRKAVPSCEKFASPDSFALFDYKNPFVRQAIWELKYRGNKKIARLLAECLYEELAEELAERKTFDNFDKPLLLPIPLSKKRQRKRGFNQCELLTDALAAIDLGNFFETPKDILVKIKDTESQTAKRRAERLANLSGCFAISDPEAISGRNVIIVDDVTTTGATLEEARKTLAKAGAKKVLAVTIAH